MNMHEICHEFTTQFLELMATIIDIIHRPGLETDHVSALLITGHPCC